MQNIEELQKKASQGDAEAQFHLACSYFNGEGIERNTAKAVEWFGKAADQDDDSEPVATAQLQLGIIYATGSGGVTQNIDEAVRLWKKAANNGYLEPHYRLGALYEHHLGNIVEAIKWHTIAANAGHAMSQFCLGNIYHNGKDGNGENPKEAYKWFKMALDNGFADSKNTVDAYEQNGWHL